MSECRLILGDAISVLPTLDGIDAVVTDPPYGINLRDNSQGGKHGRTRPAWECGIAGDESQDVGIKVLSWCELQRLPTVAFSSPKLAWPGRWSSYLVWDKGGAVGGGGDVRRCWKQTWEMIQVARAPVLNGERDAAVLRYAVTPALSAVHPAAKPVPLLKYLIQKISQPGDTIFDPFMGIGATGVACMQTGRNFIGVELSPDYFAIAQKRIDKARVGGPLFA